MCSSPSTATPTNDLDDFSNTMNDINRFLIGKVNELINKYNAIITSKEEVIQGLVQENHALNNRVSELTTHNQDLSREHANLTTQVNDLTSRNQKQKLQIETLKMQLLKNRMQRIVNDEINKLKDQAILKDEKIHHLTANADSFKALLDQRTSENKQKDEEISQLKAQLQTQIASFVSPEPLNLSVHNENVKSWGLGNNRYVQIMDIDGHKVLDIRQYPERDGKLHCKGRRGKR